MDIISFLLARKYVDDSLAGMGSLKGLSAYEIAQKNGFTGSEQDWLNSLAGSTPYIGENGNWFTGDIDTGVAASPSTAHFATKDFVASEISKIDTSAYATKEEVKNLIDALVFPDVDNFITREEFENTAYITQEDLTSEIEATKEYTDTQTQKAREDFESAFGIIEF
jgi:hypothetical protein